MSLASSSDYYEFIYVLGVAITTPTMDVSNFVESRLIVYVSGLIIMDDFGVETPSLSPSSHGMSSAYVRGGFDFNLLTRSF